MQEATLWKEQFFTCEESRMASRFSEHGRRSRVSVRLASKQ